MFDERSLYIKQLLRNYKQGSLPTPYVYTCNYQIHDDKQQFCSFEHNEGIEFVIRYINDLEAKVKELEYVEKIIQQAKAEPRLSSLEIHNTARWDYWDGWCGNHDQRIEDATCSKCGYKHPTVRGTPELLADYCPSCHSKMIKYSIR